MLPLEDVLLVSVTALYFLLKGFKGKTKCCGFPDVIWDSSRNTGESCTTIALRSEGYICVWERGVFDHICFKNVMLLEFAYLKMKIRILYIDLLITIILHCW